MKYWGVGFLWIGGAFIIAGFAISATTNHSAPIIVWILSGICLVVAAYQYFTGHQLAEWEDYQKGLEKENVGKPRPRNPIVTLLQRFIRRQ